MHNLKNISIYISIYNSNAIFVTLHNFRIFLKIVLTFISFRKRFLYCFRLVSYTAFCIMNVCCMNVNTQKNYSLYFSFFCFSLSYLWFPPFQTTLEKFQPISSPKARWKTPYNRFLVKWQPERMCFSQAVFLFVFLKNS